MRALHNCNAVLTTNLFLVNAYTMRTICLFLNSIGEQ